MVYKSGQIFLPFCHNSRVCQTDRQTEFSSLDRVCIPCSAVKNHNAEAEVCMQAASKLTKVAKIARKLRSTAVYGLRMHYECRSAAIFNIRECLKMLKLRMWMRMRNCGCTADPYAYTCITRIQQYAGATEIYYLL